MIPPPATSPLLSQLESALKRWVRARPRAAALTGFGVLMGWLACVWAVSPSEVSLAGDWRGAEVRLNGQVVAGPVATVWPAGGFEVRVRRAGRADVVLKGRVWPLARTRVVLPPAGEPVAAPASEAPVSPVEKPPPPITEEDIAAKVDELERATDAQLLATPPSDREAQIARQAAIRAFARCRAAEKWDRSVMVFAPACLWARAHPGAFAADPWDAAASAADLAPSGVAGRAFLCLARLARALERAADSAASFERAEADARRGALDGNLDGAIAVANDALALSPPEPARGRFEDLLATCRKAAR